MLAASLLTPFGGSLFFLSLVRLTLKAASSNSAPIIVNNVDIFDLGWLLQYFMVNWPPARYSYVVIPPLLTNDEVPPLLTNDEVPPSPYQWWGSSSPYQWWGSPLSLPMMRFLLSLTNDEVPLAGDGLEDGPVWDVWPGWVGEVPVVRVGHNLPRPGGGKEQWVGLSIFWHCGLWSSRHVTHSLHKILILAKLAC